MLVPFSELLLPPYLYYLPNSTPEFFLFDTSKDKRIESNEKKQAKAHALLLPLLMERLAEKGHTFEDFTQLETFRQDFYLSLTFLEDKLNYNDFGSRELRQVAYFFDVEPILGNYMLTKSIHLFTLHLPNLLWFLLTRVAKIKSL
jgi:hypothetical protein